MARGNIDVNFACESHPSLMFEDGRNKLRTFVAHWINIYLLAAFANGVDQAVQIVRIAEIIEIDHTGFLPETGRSSYDLPSGRSHEMPTDEGHYSSNGLVAKKKPHRLIGGAVLESSLTIGGRGSTMTAYRLCC
jgi:hypothetical protein